MASLDIWDIIWLLICWSSLASGTSVASSCPGGDGNACIGDVQASAMSDSDFVIFLTPPMNRVSVHMPSQESEVADRQIDHEIPAQGLRLQPGQAVENAGRTISELPANSSTRAYCQAPCTWYRSDCVLIKPLVCNSKSWPWILIFQVVVLFSIYLCGHKLVDYRNRFDWDPHECRTCQLVLGILILGLVGVCWCVAWIALGLLWIGLAWAGWWGGLCWAIWVALGVVYVLRSSFGDRFGRSFRDCFRIDEWLYGTREERREARNRARAEMSSVDAPVKFEVPGADSETIERTTSIILYQKWGCDGAHCANSSSSCTVCLEDFQEGRLVRVLPCLHTYHVACIDEWLTESRICPVCKHDIAD